MNNPESRGWGEGSPQQTRAPESPELAPIVGWIPVRLVQIAGDAVGISIKTSLVPRETEQRYFVAWVFVDGKGWRQEFTLLKGGSKNYDQMLATGAGGKALLELYKRGARYILIGDLRPAP